MGASLKQNHLGAAVCKREGDRGTDCARADNDHAHNLVRLS